MTKKYTVKQLKSMIQSPDSYKRYDLSRAIKQLLARLELGYAYDINGNRIECDVDIDGIEARECTIELQDDYIKKLEGKIKELEGES